MKRTISILLLILMISISLTGCDDIDTQTVTSTTTEEKEALTFTAKFYDNYGAEWLAAEGKTFNISPNKIKEYYYDSNGIWTWGYALSSVMTIDIDGHYIQSCGSTVIFADTRLKEYTIEFETDIKTDAALESTDSSTISTPKDLTTSDYFNIQYWWKSKSLSKGSQGNPKIVVVQSQLGNPICMYVGEDVTWDIPKNLPKTTTVTIDGKALYIHRANFAIIDTSLFK